MTIRLARHGKKNDPFYRIVAIDERKKLNGAPSEVLGFWYPKKGDLKLDRKLVEAWVAKGASISAAVAKLINNKK